MLTDSLRQHLFAVLHVGITHGMDLDMSNDSNACCTASTAERPWFEALLLPHPNRQEHEARPPKTRGFKPFRLCTAHGGRQLGDVEVHRLQPSLHTFCRKRLAHVLKDMRSVH